MADDSHVATRKPSESDRMRFRLHLGRPLDFTYWSNRAIALIALIALLAAGLLAFTEETPSFLWAPAYVFGAWALGREVDPDHEWTALVAGIGAGAWVLAGQPPDAIGALFGLMVAARLVVNTTGRRPLVVDYMWAGALAIVISRTTAGWAAGFGIAVAMYVDDRMADEQRPMAVYAAALTALIATAVATASNVFPQAVPDVQSAVIIAVGAIALIAVSREPETPVSVVDSRLKNLVAQTRLHVGRSLVAVLTFLAAFLSGPGSTAVIPIAGTLVLALAANEAERIRR